LGGQVEVRGSVQTEGLVSIRPGGWVNDYFKTLAGELDVTYQTLVNFYLRDCATTRRRPAMHWRASRPGAA
jgi:hypothetical protein